MRKVVIIGAGLTGLSTAYALARRSTDHDVVVIEEKEIPGGLAKTVPVFGGHADTGPHRYHSKKPELMDFARELLKGRMRELTRMSHIYMERKYFRYPLEGINVAVQLPPTMTISIFLDYVRANLRRGERADNNFEDWVVARFGRKMYDIYFGPYTEKVWGIPPSQISADWADQRIRLLNLKQALTAALFPNSQARKSLVSRFLYPANGGIGALSDAMMEYMEAKGIKVRTGERVRSVSVGEKVRVVTDSGSVEGDFLVSTIPVNELIRMLEPHPPIAVKEAAEKLRFRALVFVYLLVDRPGLRKDHWIYYPQEDVIFNRLSEERNFNADIVPEGKTIVCAEVTCNPGDRVWEGGEWLVKRVASDMAKVGLINGEEDVLDSYIYREKAAYPVYDLEYEANLDRVMEFLRGRDNMVSIGRNGLFRYNNMDHSIEMGLTAGRLLVEKASTDKIYDSMAQIMKEKEFLG